MRLSIPTLCSLISGAALSTLVPLGGMSPATAAVHNVEVVNFTFAPAQLTIPVGDTVRWLRISGLHTVTEGDCGNEDPLFHGELNLQNNEYLFTFTDAGVYDYHCVPHCLAVGMAGVVTVQTSSAAEELDAAPAFEFSVFPNPMRESSQLVLALSHESRVAITIHDAGGRVVAELSRGLLASGAHRFTWRGVDGSGRRVPAGAYFARVAADGVQQVATILLVH